ncbi:hypothetical protein EC991_002128 [Linnemannia zychae]|nr:hypothetical protein EC991_002128 [Linnemannia zychae]
MPLLHCSIKQRPAYLQHSSNSSNLGDNDSGPTSPRRQRKRDILRNFLRRLGPDESTGQQKFSKSSDSEIGINDQEQNASQAAKNTIARCASFPNNGVQRLLGEDLPEFGSRDSGPGELQREWMQDLEKDPLEQERIRWLGIKMVEEFIKDPLKDSTTIAEILLLGPVLEKEHYRKLLGCFIAEFNRSPILDICLLQGSVQLVQDARAEYLLADDLVAILAILRTHLQNTHQQDTEHPFHLTLAVSRILDVIADHKVQDLDRITQQEPLSEVLSSLKDNSDPFLMYQAAYAFQALQYVPKNETPLQAVVRYSTGVTEGLVKVAGLVQLDLGGLLEGLNEIQNIMGETFDTAKSAYEGTLSLMENGRGLFDSLREGLGSGHKRPWYLAVRSADALVQEGRLADLSGLIRDAPCRRDPLFQWGISQLLAEIIVDPDWDSSTRQQSIIILSDLFRNDPDWKRDASVREWVQILLKMVASVSDQTIKNGADRLLEGLTIGVNAVMSSTYPLRTRLSTPKSLLLVKVQEIPPVEYKLHRFKAQRLKPRYHQVYVKPEAKAALLSSDEDLFSLEDNVWEFLGSTKEVMLILGDSGSGKSTFSRYLEQELWKQYREGDSIPLFITLPSIVNPQENMIAKQLEIYEFTEEQDGQWRAKMIISCRSQHVKSGYQDWFKPQRDRYLTVLRPGPDLFQEAVIAPFSRPQIRSYVDQYVKSDDNHFTSDKPLDWTTDDYMNSLAGIRDLMGLVSNPFLLSLALVALPSLVNTTEELKNVRVSRVQLYDIFADNWLTCALKRLRGSTMSEADREELETLASDFGPVAMEYLKELSTAIFEKQDGNPVITFDERKDRGTWKNNFFGSNREIRLLRVSSPLISAGKNKHRFLHRSLLEYFYSRTFSDPKDPDTDSDDDEPPTFAKVRQSIIDHPLRQQSILDHPLVIQFLAERAQVDVTFKQQLLAMVESLEVDAQSMQAAVQAVEILTMARIRFNGFNLSGARVQRQS